MSLENKKINILNIVLFNFISVFCFNLYVFVYKNVSQAVFVNF